MKQKQELKFRVGDKVKVCDEKQERVSFYGYWGDNPFKSRKPKEILLNNKIGIIKIIKENENEGGDFGLLKQNKDKSFIIGVEFNRKFKGGSNLNGKCKEDRGYLIYNPNCLILLKRAKREKDENEKQKKKEYEKQERITIGSDAELSFAIGKPIPKNNFPANRFLTQSLTTQLGCDGCSSIAELRPIYSENPLEHLENVKKIIKRLIAKMDKVEITKEINGKTKKEKIESYAGNGFTYSTGGHIHFGINLRENDNFDLIKVLDLMSIFLVPYELELTAKKRRQGGYGNLGAYERKSYGFEYRTFASWLYSEHIAKSILCLAYVLAYEFMNNREHTEKMIKTFKNQFSKDTAVKIAFQNSNEKYFIKSDFNFYEYFMKNVSKMLMYERFKPYINTLFSLLYVGKKFPEKNGITKGWKEKIIKDKNGKVKKKTEKEDLNNLFFFNIRDDFMNIIEGETENPKVKDLGLWIFGLNRKREKDEKGNFDIAVNNKNLKPIIEKFTKQHKPKLKLNIGIIPNYKHNAIGFSYALREKGQEIIKDLLKYLSENLKKKDLKGKDIYNKGVDFENMNAETDTEQEDDDEDICSGCGNHFDYCECERDDDL